MKKYNKKELNKKEEVCEHKYVNSIFETYPRKCIKCGKLETIQKNG